MINTCFDKKSLIEFFDKVETYLFCDCLKKEELKESFLKIICQKEENADCFISSLCEVKKELDKDLSFFFESDPAAESKEEIIACYPGYKAIIYYRVSNLLYKLGYRVTARIISEEAHKITGIDIHPGATIATPFFIDHGTGVVIGETSIIGKNVKIYQGVTIGALSLSKGQKMKGIKRHPTIGSHVTIYANATILGGDVVIGNNVVIGSNVFLTESVPDDYKVSIQKPELIFTKKNK